VKYKYPKLSNALTYKKIDGNTVEVTDFLTDDSYIFDIDSVRYIRQLDGKTHPYKIQTVLNREEIQYTIQFLNENNLIRYSDIINSSSGTTMKTLWIPKITPALKAFACLSNTLLILLCIPLLITGIILFMHNIYNIEFDHYIIGYIIGLIVGVFSHELGHAFAGLSYGAHVFEMGVLLMYYILPGAYVMTDSSVVKKRMHRIQIYAAGVETNFLLSGIFLIFGSLFPLYGGLFMNAALCNGILGLINLAFVNGLDGASIISELLGMEKNIAAFVIEVIFERKFRQRIIRQCPCGYAVIAVCVILGAFQIILPVFLVLNVMEVIECFV